MCRRRRARRSLHQRGGRGDLEIRRRADRSHDHRLTCRGRSSDICRRSHPTRCRGPDDRLSARRYGIPDRVVPGRIGHAELLPRLRTSRRECLHPELPRHQRRHRGRMRSDRRHRCPGGASRTRLPERHVRVSGQQQHRPREQREPELQVRSAGARRGSLERAASEPTTGRRHQHPVQRPRVSDVRRRIDRPGWDGRVLRVGLRRWRHRRRHRSAAHIRRRGHLPRHPDHQG